MTTPSLVVADVGNVAQAQITQLAFTCIRSDEMTTEQGSHSLATAYDGMTIYPPSGTITGSVRVYGYRNS